MYGLLETYMYHDSFEFSPTDNLREKCNAPNDCCGVYIVTAYFGDGKQEVVYIGSSGHIEGDELISRKGGLRRRIVGRQKDIESCKLTFRTELWPKLMTRQFISKLDISWYNTGEDNPLIVEYCLILEYIICHKRLPAWNNELKLNGQLKGELEKFITKNNIEILTVMF